MGDINIEILYFYKKIVHLNSRQEKRELLGKAKKGDIQKIIGFWRHMLIKQAHDEQMEMTTRLVKQILVVFQKNQHLNNITAQQINEIANYIEKIKKYEDIVNIIDILFLQRQLHIFSKCSSLFKTLVNHFQYLQNDEVRQIVVQNLAEMMKQNQQLLAYANNPYYFLEYMLQVINLQEDKVKVIDWMKTMQKLFLFQNAEKYLFYENDFRIFVDIVVRHIQNYDSWINNISLNIFNIISDPLYHGQGFSLQIRPGDDSFKRYNDQQLGYKRLQKIITVFNDIVIDIRQ